MKSMISGRIGIFLLLVFVFLSNACTQSGNPLEKKTSGPNANQPAQNVAPIYALTPEQQSAFDALNTLQISTDERNRLYSTFAGSAQPCYPLDTSLNISQVELLEAMKQFVTDNCKRLTIEEGNDLATTSVLAQQTYSVSLCLNNSENVSYKDGIPKTGTWLIPNVLGRRDIVIVW
ncbi:MAG: hypothetical protein AAF705_08590 [Bacteroidota bacterium]